MSPRIESPLVLKDVWFTYEGAQSAALRGTNLTLEQGEWLLLCGASGSGKSTIARAATGLIPHFYGGALTGRVLSGGLDTKDHVPYELFRQAALVFQNPDAQLFNATVEHEIAFGLESLGLPRQEMRARIAEASEQAGITPLMPRPPHTLSGGEKQRVAIAAALALRPPLLMLDEPFSHLDFVGAAALRTALKQVQASGTTIMVIEHRLHDLVADASQIAMMHDGAVAVCDAPRAVLAQDIERYGVGLPYPVRRFRQSGWDFVPLSATEAQEWAMRHAVKLPEERIPTSNILARDIAGKPPLVVVDTVTYTAGEREILRGVSFVIGHGECVALLGRNGAGKTTLLKIMAGLRQAARGRVRAGGLDVAALSPAERSRQIGLVFQNANDQLFLPNVREEIETGPRRLRTFDAAWTNEVIETLHLDPLLQRSPFRLSEGEKKRVAIAAVLAMRPALIVLDEPTVGQDYPTRRALIALLNGLRARGHTLLIATHDLELAEEVAPRWLLLSDGRIAADGSPDAIMANAEWMRNAGIGPTDRFVLAGVRMRQDATA